MLDLVAHEDGLALHCHRGILQECAAEQQAERPLQCDHACRAPAAAATATTARHELFDGEKALLAVEGHQGSNVRRPAVPLPPG